MKTLIKEMKRAKELGLPGTARYIQHSCVYCGKIRWVKLNKYDNPIAEKCVRCANKLNNPLKALAMENHPNWKGGKRLLAHGYIDVRLAKESPYYSMARANHYVTEHRLVIAQHLGRCLYSWEVVHHINGDRADNRFENLELLPKRSWHLVDMVMKSQLLKQNQRIEKMREQILTQQKLILRLLGEYLDSN